MTQGTHRVGQRLTAAAPVLQVLDIVGEYNEPTVNGGSGPATARSAAAGGSLTLEAFLPPGAPAGRAPKGPGGGGGDAPKAGKKPRTGTKYRTLTKEQRARLEAAFREDPKPATEAKKEMAKALGLSYGHIKTWFSNQRTKDRRGRERAAQRERAAAAAAAQGFEGLGGPAVSILHKLKAKATCPELQASLDQCILQEVGGWQGAAAGHGEAAPPFPPNGAQ